MAYNKAAIKKANAKHAEIKDDYKNLILKLSDLNFKLKSKKAKEYLMQGAGRRIVILSRCIDNVFKIFPLGKSSLLTKNELIDVDINLHAFFVNISGILDNLGWVFVYENNLLGKARDGKVNRLGVGLLNDKTIEHLNQNLKSYLTSNNIQSWYKNYCKNYRDALAHRVPLYVPPVALNNEEAEEYLLLERSLWDFVNLENIEKHDVIRKKQSQLGKPCYFFAHSINESGQPMLIHAQILTDFITIEEIVEKFCRYF